MSRKLPPTTPDGRYIVVNDKLWRTSNPNLPNAQRQLLVDGLMDARRAVHSAKRSGDAVAMKTARISVNAAKIALGERGPVWWTDGAPDWNRYLAKNTPYAEWWAQQSS